MENEEWEGIYTCFFYGVCSFLNVTTISLYWRKLNTHEANPFYSFMNSGGCVNNHFYSNILPSVHKLTDHFGALKLRSKIWDKLPDDVQNSNCSTFVYEDIWEKCLIFFYIFISF